jgi:hypothetical protein
MRELSNDLPLLIISQIAAVVSHPVRRDANVPLPVPRCLCNQEMPELHWLPEVPVTRLQPA